MAKNLDGQNARFSWCFGTPGHEIHKKCPHKVGESTCTCPCHREDNVE